MIKEEKYFIVFFVAIIGMLALLIYDIDIHINKSDDFSGVCVCNPVVVDNSKLFFVNKGPIINESFYNSSAVGTVGFWSSKGYYCVSTLNRPLDDIIGTQEHEYCHQLVYDSYEHFCLNDIVINKYKYLGVKM